MPVNQAAPMLEHTRSGGGFVSGAYLSDEEHNPVLLGVLLDALGLVFPLLWGRRS